MAEEENNSVDLSNISIKQINEMFSDILEFPDDKIAACTTCGKAVHMCTASNPTLM